MPQRKAVLIGCNYPGQRGTLRGCVNDAMSHYALVTGQLGFPAAAVQVLVDDTSAAGGLSCRPPTKDNIVAAARWLVQGAQPGDILYFSYSGHGTQVPDRTGQEADGMNEALVPTDFQETRRLIVDDELDAVLVKPLPQGAILTCFFDCCHSGTILDLDACVDGTDGCVKKRKDKKEKKKKAKDRDWDFGADAIPRAMPPVMDYEYEPMEFMERDFSMDRGASQAVFCYSGCRDDQTSLDLTVGGKSYGAMTAAVMKAFCAGGSAQAYSAVFRSIEAGMDDQRSQTPRMDQRVQLTYNECADPSRVAFLQPPYGAPAAPGQAMPEPVLFSGGGGKAGKEKKDKKAGKEKKEKKAKVPKEGKEKKSKKGKAEKRDFKDKGSSSSSSSDSD